MARAASGVAVVAAFLDAGWRVAVPWIHESELERVTEREGLELVRADLFEPDEVTRAVRCATAEPAAPLRAVVNLVGGFARRARSSTCRSSASSASSRLNLRPTYLVCAGGDSAAARRGRRRDRVRLARARGLHPFAGAAGYCASKAAVLAFAKALDAEYADDGVRANAILPSVIDTPGQPRGDAARAEHAKLVPPQQIASVILHLCSEDSAADERRRRARVRAGVTSPDMDRKWWTLIAVCVATFMLLLDITIVNVALPDIQRSLNASFSDLQWVVDAYALTLAALLLDGGSLGGPARAPARVRDRTRASSRSPRCCAGSPARRCSSTSPAALQGIGGAMMFATSLALIAAAFQGRERGTAIGVWGATIGAAVAIGPLVGGVLIDAHRLGVRSSSSTCRSASPRSR